MTSLKETLEINFPRYINRPYPKEFFNEKVLLLISSEVTNQLRGIHQEGKNIIVPDKTILSVMDNIYNLESRIDINTMIKMVIVYIVEYIKNDFDIISKNNKLDIEVQKYTEEYGIRKVPSIKLREKRPTPFLFNMHY